MKGNIDKLDFLRGIAILLVFGYHSLLVIFEGFEIKHYGSFLLSDEYTLGQILLNLTPVGMGFLGVQLFLILSGFLIHLGYLKAGQRIEYLRFYNKRVWRIYPAYLLALVLFAITVGHNGPLDLFSHLGLFHTLIESSVYSINPSFWSLALEMQLYLLYPLYLVLRQKLGLNKSVLAVAVVSITLLALGSALGWNKSYVYHKLVFSQWIVWVLGAYLAERYSQGERLYTAHPIWFAVALLVLLPLRLTVVFDAFSKIFYSLYFVYLIDWCLHTNFKVRPFWEKIGKVVNLIGLCSYSIYLFHQPFLKAFIHFFSPSGSKSYLFVGSALSFLMFFALSYVCYRVVELRFIKIGNQLYSLVTKGSKKEEAAKEPVLSR
ncbi:acyltransferase family protein [Rufibacter aurantiacus]|uniref:acyltransferase family protein n=1 Tax=Rufibacter aurantiacus TaxID=2817374 RepID=UPI001B307761|nr:acyltransferase [Rufibacter aurantiacus]